MTTAGAPFAAAPPDEDYIDMELSSSPSSNLFSHSIESSPSPPPLAIDFEFQIGMTSFSDETEVTNSPADELFYNGKLLPLHLHPRLEMVEKLISKTPSTKQHSFQIPLISIKAPPHESCNFSLTESRRPSCEVNPDEFLFGIKDPPTKSWSKKVKQLKKSLKALFSKTESVFENRGSSGKFINVSKTNPFGRIDYSKWKIKNNYLEKELNGGILKINNNRKSFSEGITNGVCDLQFIKRSVSSNSEIERSIEGAIAHCKQSQKVFVKSKENEESNCSKVLACGDQKSLQLCRI